MRIYVLILINLQMAPARSLNHFTMGNMLAASADDQAAFFYEMTLRYQPDFSAAWQRLEALRCAQLRSA